MAEPEEAMPSLSNDALTVLILLQDLKPTVCLDVTSVVVYTYGCGDGRIAGIVSRSLFFEEIGLTI
jgi:hypothetical protein